MKDIIDKLYEIENELDELSAKLHHVISAIKKRQENGH